LECAVAKVHSYVVGICTWAKRLYPGFSPWRRVPSNRVGPCLFKIDGKLPRRTLDPELRACLCDPEHPKRTDYRDNCDRHDHLHNRESILLRRRATIAFHLASTSESTHVAEDKLRPWTFLWQHPCPYSIRMNCTHFHRKSFQPASGPTDNRYLR